ncbi:antA/AntB antirepressor family protein, partial [Alloprevotella tannerae]|uniref:antA/AntB antirepressor family protein n=1 Tax=Alloprevotella tannerae TaxID=76122 RepID=UPI0028E4693B
MEELIKVDTNENLEPVVSGRELHEILEVQSNYTTWFKRMCEYGFDENVDYKAVFQNWKTAQGNETQQIDH